MPNSSGDKASSRIETLRQREAALKAAIAEEKVRQQKREEKEDARLHSIVGATLIHNARQHPDFELMLKGVLAKSTKLTDAETKLLRAKGWL
jgi:hypothetical protein